MLEAEERRHQAELKYRKEQDDQKRKDDLEREERERQREIEREERERQREIEREQRAEIREAKRQRQHLEHSTAMMSTAMVQVFKQVLPLLCSANSSIQVPAQGVFNSGSSTQITNCHSTGAPVLTQLQENKPTATDSHRESVVEDLPQATSPKKELQSSDNENE